ncbi:hypothetical protein [Butyrivibrio sp. AE2005]|uniref:hypothetical protein n=2 Tax=unclassified Butyrivibrio TaxID=2639466 RepID=UPI00047D9F46|nr:hypothetical protein [Butyrivibrio sp. AE2005]MEE3470021.1 hypothetical protein [Butyrivibrio hungatei]
MICSERLEMPINYLCISKSEMEYLEGGKPTNLPISTAYLSRSYCISKAEWLLTYGFCNNMDVLDVAKEIFGHACAAYYAGAAKVAVAASAALIGANAGAVCAEIDALSAHAMNGIDLEDHKDTASRVMAFEACWALGNLGILGTK